ncbi:hypothetical protein NDU88_006334 [Pleurodeles waltl]|uniref:Uncharacterized protein n=1 Tax=Pleurodeles waltl TaxID=8319 RepID=A0AAV7TY97_PLEWA|nr:hypothetical protein NDU88_006334 [Pleurodeles waltl]
MGAWLPAQDGRCLIWWLRARASQYVVHRAESLLFSIPNPAYVVVRSDRIQRHELERFDRDRDRGVCLLSHAVLEQGGGPCRRCA